MFNQCLCFHSFFLTVCLLCLSLSWVSYGDVEKSTHPMSAQCAAGEQIVIDLASAPTPWRWRWQWQRDWGLGERERKYIASYLQLNSNNVNPKLYFCLVYILQIPSQNFPSPACLQWFSLLLLAFISFPLCLTLFVFTSLPYLLLSFWQEQWFYYPTSPLPGWVRYCSGAAFTWHLT